MVRNLIQIQDAYINTYHPDFMGGANSIVNVFDVNNYQQEQLNMMQLKNAQKAASNGANQPDDSFEQLGSGDEDNQKVGQ